MQPKLLIVFGAAFQSLHVLAAPVASDENALAFNGPGYYKNYRVAADTGLIEKEKRESDVKRGAGAPVEFQASSYRPIYREAEKAYDVGTKERREPASVVEFKDRGYARLYREAKDAGLAE